MKYSYIAAGSFLLFFLFFSVMITSTHAASYGNATQNSSIEIAINNTGTYLTTVNRSAYLIFYPDMTQPYMYYNEAINASKNDTPLAYSLLAEAKGSAQYQENKIYTYRYYSFFIMIALSVVFALLLYYVMRPIKSSR
jgi:hypothetical protein